MRLDLHLPQVPVQKVFDAIPPEVVPLLEGLRMRGQLAWKLVVDFDTAVPAALRIDSRPNLSAFEVETLGTEIDFVRLHGAQAYRILLSDGSEGTRFVGPTTASWVPLEQIARWLPLALTTTEDGTFYTNDGISTFAIEESIIANLERGAFVRGASTITQQLVKNLYLGGSKKLGRKLQEIFLAWRLTQFMSKDRIMELYLNTIEFGPGIYGVGDAAWHWFGKRAADLDLAECIFLASIIPAPRKYHSFFEAGAVTPRWSAYLQMLLNVMVKREKITPEERDAAAPFAPRFRGQGAGSGDAAIFDTLPDRDAPNGDEAAPSDDDWDGDLLDGR
jgi:membrane peptidoglycan carboxypeptidase